MKHMVTKNQKSTRDIEEIERKESKHSTTKSHQQEKRAREKERNRKEPQNN